MRDVRHLGNALDQLVAVAETGVTHPAAVRGEESTLVDDGNVDIDALEDVIDDLRGVSTRLADAQAELADVNDSALVVGDRLAEARDQAQAEVDPLADSLETIDPLLDAAARGPRPRRRAGSTSWRCSTRPRCSTPAARPQTFVPVDSTGGRLSMGETVDLRPPTRRGPAPLLEEGQRQPASTAGS